MHGVSIDWLHDLFKQDGITATYQYTGCQHADMFTNNFKDISSWNSVRSIVGIRPPLPLTGGNATGGSKVKINVSLQTMVDHARVIATKPPPRVVTCACAIRNSTSLPIQCSVKRAASLLFALPIVTLAISGREAPKAAGAAATPAGGGNTPAGMAKMTAVLRR